MGRRSPEIERYYYVAMKQFVRMILYAEQKTEKT
jgi:hypothetical protein